MNQLWPDGARADENGDMWLGGCAVAELARAYGTPLYIYDEMTLRAGARAYRRALDEYYPGTAQAAYASKAYLCTAIAALFAEERLDLDVVSGGELSVALHAGFPADAHPLPRQQQIGARTGRSAGGGRGPDRGGQLP